MIEQIIINSFLASIIGILICCLKLILKNKINPKWFILLWVFFIVRLLIPINIYNESQINYGNIQRIESNQISKEIETKGNINIENNFNNVAIKDTKSISKSNLYNEVYTKITTKISNNFNIYKESIYKVYLIGFLIIFSYFIFIYFSTRFQINRMRNCYDKYLMLTFENQKKRLGINNNINLIIQNELPSPGIFNNNVLVSPTIYNLKSNEIEYIFLHELIHFKYKHNLINSFLNCIKAVFWFNPLIIYFINRIKIDMEIQTDMIVLQTIDKTKFKEYGQVLLKVVEQNIINNKKVLLLSSDKNNLKTRISLIKIGGKNMKYKVFIIGLTSIILIGTTFFISVNAQKIYKVQNINKIENINKKSSNLQLDEEKLLSLRNKYIGNNWKDADIVGNINFGNVNKTIELKTEKEPYSMIVNYTGSLENVDNEKMSILCKQNALILFSLIENMSIVEFKIGDSKYVFNKKTFEKSDFVLWNQSDSKIKFKEFMKKVLNNEILDNESNQEKKDSVVEKRDSEIKKLGVANASVDAIKDNMLWPVPSSKNVSSLYGNSFESSSKITKLHSGIDIAGPIGTSVIAAQDGIVIEAGYFESYGKYVLIDHGYNVTTKYAHNSEIIVKKGDKVTKGQEICKIGLTGATTGPHLHFEVLVNKETCDPMKFIKW